MRKYILWLVCLMLYGYLAGTIIGNSLQTVYVDIDIPIGCIVKLVAVNNDIKKLNEDGMLLLKPNKKYTINIWLANVTGGRSCSTLDYTTDNRMYQWIKINDISKVLK